jgi:hypothetical protein
VVPSALLKSKDHATITATHKYHIRPRRCCVAAWLCRAAHGRLPYTGTGRTLVAVLTSD